MGIFYNQVKWIRTSNQGQINSERENEGFLVVSGTIMDDFGNYIRAEMKPSEEFTFPGQSRPIITRFDGLPNGPVIEHYECTVPPVNHAIAARLHCANVGDSPFIIELSYEQIDELENFLKRTGLPLESRVSL